MRYFVFCLIAVFASPVFAINNCLYMASSISAACPEGPSRFIELGACQHNAYGVMPACCIHNLDLQGNPQPYDCLNEPGGTQGNGWTAINKECTVGEDWSYSSESGPNPATVCINLCLVETDGPETCFEVPGNAEICTATGHQTGDTCAPGYNGNEPPENFDEGPPESDPENESQCEGEVCWYIEYENFSGTNTNGGPPPTPGVCADGGSGPACRPGGDPPPLGCNQANGIVICTGSGPPSGAQYQGADPDSTMTVTSSGPDGSSATNYTAFLEPGQEFEPDGNGDCGANAAQVRPGVCVCVTGYVRTGNGVCALDDGEDDGEEDGERTSSLPASCAEMPACSGDEIDCDALEAQWRTFCALTGTEPAPTSEEIGLDDADGWDPYADGTVTVQGLDAGLFDGVGGWLGAGSCPESFGGSTPLGNVEIPNFLCEFTFLGSLIMLIGYFIAVRIAGGA